jgi:hypothetical protein
MALALALIRRMMAWLRRGFAGSFVALGAKLALAAR